MASLAVKIRVRLRRKLSPEEQIRHSFLVDEGTRVYEADLSRGSDHLWTARVCMPFLTKA